MPIVLWGARIGLLACFFGHIITTIMLVIQNRRSKGSQYVYKHTNKASGASRTMIWSGIIIICFVIYHILHYTVRFANDYDSSAYIDPNGNHDVTKCSSMVSVGGLLVCFTFFQWPYFVGTSVMVSPACSKPLALELIKPGQ